MIVSIHQPHYLPWLPYFSKINKSDIFVFLDDVQFQKNGLQNRNQLKNSNGRFWLTVPVSVNLGDKLHEVKIVNNGWRNKHIKSINMNYSKALNFELFIKNIEPIIAQESVQLVDLNINIIEILCLKYFNINTKFIRQSDIGTSTKGTKLILDICKKLGANKYISGPGGKNYLNENDFKKNNIEIVYLTNSLPMEYPQLYPKVGFINDLSALDFILHVGPEWVEYHNL